MFHFNGTVLKAYFRLSSTLQDRFITFLTAFGIIQEFLYRQFAQGHRECCC